MPEQAPAGRILNVDDEPATRYTVTRVLKHAGFDVIEAASGREALALARELPDLILLDVQLPDINGLDVCRRLKADSATRAIPILQVSSNFITGDDRAHGLNVGADAYLTHPIEPAVLIATTRALLRTRRAERSLAMEMERLATTLKGIGDAVIATDPQQKIELMNPVAERLTGWNQDEARGHPLSEIYSVVDAGSRAPFVHSIASREEESGAEQVAVLIERNGTERLIAEKASRIGGEGAHESGFVFVFRDITERRRMEEELAKAQKLESLGVLAGGIAHDFNNILTAILGNISLSRLPGAEQEVLLGEAEDACMRARHLTNQLLTFARGGAPIKRPVQIAHLLREITEFALRGSVVTACYEIDDRLMPIEADPDQIGQAISNLIINARESMPNGGRVYVSADSVELERTRKPLMQGRYVRIVVRDEGTGIAPEHLSKIFDPFFTTKAHGSGLGLSSAYSIVKKHGGHIEVESEPGAGTRFSIFLPTTGQKPQNETRTQRLRRGAGRILVMDDDDSILDLTQKLLSRLGYGVDCARSGAEAVDAYRDAMRRGTGFDAVILDLTIPDGMGGRDCLERLSQLNPSVIALVSSGYSNDPIMADPGRFGFAGVLSKPYRLEELSERLAAALAGAGVQSES